MKNGFSIEGTGEDRGSSHINGTKLENVPVKQDSHEYKMKTLKREIGNM